MFTGEQPSQLGETLLKHAKKQHSACAAIVAKGVVGKFQALREAQVEQWVHTVSVLETLLEGAGGGTDVKGRS